MSRVRLHSLVLTVVLILAGIAAALAGPAPGITPEDARKIMPVREVKPGMRGYGLTVFRGTKVEKFDVKVISVLKKVNLGKDLILVKMGGGPITARGANIIEGMSGSPVYIGGRIVGAVAYGGEFAKEPLALLTPIEDMLEALDPALPPRPSGHSSEPMALASPVEVGGRSITSVLFSRSPHVKPRSTGTLKIVPLMTPVMVSGMSPRGIAQLRELLEPYGLMPMAGPGRPAEKVSASLVPGAAVGVGLSTGDIELTGVGTLTYRRGNKIVAFGHPMLGIGPIDAPMTTAYIHDIFPSYLASSKIASPIEVKGRIGQDRPWSVGGEIGKMPNMIPLSITVDDQTTKRRRNLNIKVINHPLLASRLSALLVAEAIYESHATPGDATARVRFQVEADKYGKIERENVFFHPVAVDMAAIEDLQRLLTLLSNNKFYPLDIKSVKMQVTITGRRDTATIEGALVQKSKYEPGETIDVELVLRPYKKDRITRHLKLEIPRYASDGRYTLSIRGGSDEGGARLSIMPSSAAEQDGGRDTAPITGLATADNVRQLIEKYLEREKNNEIVAKLLFPTTAMVVSGEKLSRLPAPLVSMIRSSRASGQKSEREEVKVVLPTEFVVTGSQSLQILIERPNLSDRRGPQRPEPSITAGAPAETPSDASSGAEESGSSDDQIVIDEMAFRPKDDVGDLAWIRPQQARNPAAQAKPRPAVEARGTAPLERPETTPKPETKKPEKAIARQPSTWRQSSYSDFSAGTFEGAAATTKDEVRLAPKLRKLADIDEIHIWSIAVDGAGGAYAGTGWSGRVIHVSKDGKSEVLFDSDELAIHSLLADGDAVYAGTSPNGLVYRIEGSKAEKIFDAPEKYILAMARDSKGTIYFGAGDGAAIYRLSGGRVEKFATLPEPELLSLAIDASDNLYAGTGPNGVVYKIAPTGQTAAVFDASETHAAAVAVDQAGNLWVGTSPKGIVYRIPASGIPKAVLENSPGPITALAPAPGGVYAATEGQVFMVGADDRVFAVDTMKSRIMYSALAVDPFGTIFAGASNTAAVYAAAGDTSAGTYESTVHDAKLAASWGTISWDAEVPAGASITLQTRTGNSSTPDITWSDWSGHYVNAACEKITSPPGRYIQYRANFRGTRDASPVLKSVSVVYLPANQPPKVTIISPAPGARWSGKQTVKWSGTDPDNDTLIYDVYYSSDNGVTWKALRKGVKSRPESEAKPEEKKPSEEKPESATSEKSPAKQAVEELKVENKLRAEVEGNSNIPRDVKNEIIEEIPALAKELAKASAETEKPAEKQKGQMGDEKSEPSKETSYNWDTTSLDDGRYILKVVASDRISNGAGFLTAEKTSLPFIITNKPPRVMLFRKSISVQQDKSVIAKGYTYHTLVEIAGVQYRVDSGEWMAAAADDGLFDTAAEAFTIHTLPLEAGERTVEVKSVDAAGNTAVTKTKVKIQ